MKNITVIVTKGAILGNVEGPRQIFNEVNSLFERMGKPPLFNIRLAGLTNESILNDGLYRISTIPFNEIESSDLIIVPAMYGNLQTAIEENKDFIPWVVEKYNSGSEVASLCLGAFLLASTGLLNGKKCATHWLAANEFRKMFP